MSDEKRVDDLVNSPPHYRQGGVECIDAIAAALTAEEFAGFLKGQVIKYLWRARHKGATQQDHEKAAWYLGRLVKAGEKEKEKEARRG